jgi:hypothetical protein
MCVSMYLYVSMYYFNSHVNLQVNQICFIQFHNFSSLILLLGNETYIVLLGFLFYGADMEYEAG